MAEFKSALPYPLKWNVGENKFDEDGKWPLSLALQIPIESIDAFVEYLMDLKREGKKAKKTSWDFSQNKEVEVEVVYINGKGRDGEWGKYGNINPRKIDSGIPF